MSEYTTVTEQEADLVEEQRPAEMAVAEVETAATVQEDEPTAIDDPATKAGSTVVNGPSADRTEIDDAAPVDEQGEEEDVRPVKPVQAGLRPGLRTGLSR